MTDVTTKHIQHRVVIDEARGYDVIGATWDATAGTLDAPLWTELAPRQPVLASGVNAVPEDMVMLGGKPFVVQFLTAPGYALNVLRGDSGAWVNELTLSDFFAGPPRLVTDGTNLFMAALRQDTNPTGPSKSSCLIPPGQPGSSAGATTYTLVVYKRDSGGTWTQIGTVYAYCTNATNGGAMAILDMAASSAEVGACYIAVRQYGFVHVSALSLSPGMSDCSVLDRTEVHGFGAAQFGSDPDIAGNIAGSYSRVLHQAFLSPFLSDPVTLVRLANDTGEPQAFYVDGGGSTDLKAANLVDTPEPTPGVDAPLTYPSVVVSETLTSPTGGAPAHLNLSEKYLAEDARTMRWMLIVWTGQADSRMRCRQIIADLSTGFEHIRGDSTLEVTTVIFSPAPNVLTIAARYDAAADQHWAFTLNTPLQTGWRAGHLTDKCGSYIWRQQQAGTVVAVPQLYAGISGVSFSGDSLYTIGIPTDDTTKWTAIRLDVCRDCHPCPIV